MQDEFISGTSAAYLESLEDQWREDPGSVPASWASLLRQMGA
jgi:2-oxoglutarate dehydrogenase E1 component